MVRERARQAVLSVGTILIVRARAWRQDNAHSKNRKRLTFPSESAPNADSFRGAITTHLPARVRSWRNRWNCWLEPARHAGLFAERIPLRPTGRAGRAQEDHLSVLLGRMLDLGRGPKRRLGWSGARV